jgi:S-DNA-T family DNA segregation ATPase FtsK/SpoIIIE
MKGITEEEIYNPEIMNILNSKWETVGAGDISSEDEQLVQQAIEIIKQTRRASATLLQRKLWIGFARAARIMDILEERWIVWPQEGAKPREIYI